MTAPRVSREQVLAYRVVAQNLDRRRADLDALAVLDIGVQDSGADAALLAFDARQPHPPTADEPDPVANLGGSDFTLVWSLRGAPHIHRRRDVDALAGALYPLSDADAATRLGETGRSLAQFGIGALPAFALAVDALASVVTGPLPKGVVSTEVTRLLPHGLGRDCRVCQARHLSDPMMRLASLAAGLELQPGTAPPVLQPRPSAARVGATDSSALRSLVLAYLTVLGPATPAEVAGYLEARRADLAVAWPRGPGDSSGPGNPTEPSGLPELTELTEISVDGRAAWLPTPQLEHLLAAPAPELTRLLGPFDPWVQARDRALIVPDPAVRKALWPVLGRPGVLVVDGEVAGCWRPKLSGRRLTISVDAFVTLPDSTWRLIEDEAARVARVRGAADVQVRRAA